MEKTPQNNFENVVNLDEYRQRKEKPLPESGQKPGQKVKVLPFEKLQERKERKEREELIKELGLPEGATEDEINRAIVEKVGGVE
ncbi:MAG: hypothetical protein HYT98_00905 [Candidatus Sungbacteria bacterium]|nr:hypothetical protein [Candidatus Sungbacteria bacterium]